MDKIIHYIINRKVSVSWFDIFEFILDIFSWSSGSSGESKGETNKIVKWLLIGLISFGIIYLIYNIFIAIGG